MEDLTIQSFAYLRLPLFVAGIAFLVGMFGSVRWTGQKAFLASALMMVIFFQAARLALVDFDPFMSSRSLAESLLRSPQGELIVEGHYYPFSSVFFYTNRSGLLLNGKKNNLEYGSNAPGVADVFIDDSEFKSRWLRPERYYFITNESDLSRFEELLGDSNLNVVTASGGKVLLTNHSLGSHT
jgi:hypothetical protein